MSRPFGANVVVAVEKANTEFENLQIENETLREELRATEELYDQSLKEVSDLVAAVQDAVQKLGIAKDICRQERGEKEYWKKMFQLSTVAAMERSFDQKRVIQILAKLLTL